MPNVVLYGPTGKPLRVTPDDELLIAGGGDAFARAVDKGRVFGVASQVGIASQAGLSATTPTMTLANLAGSGVIGKLWYAAASYEVVFAAVAAIWLAVGKHQTAVTLTTLATTVRNLKTLDAVTAADNKIKAATVATLPAAPVGIALLGHGLTGAVTTIPGKNVYDRWFNGGLRIPETANVSIQTSAASGATGQWVEFIWEEVDA